jgi:hypothetical protein
MLCIIYQFLREVIFKKSNKLNKINITLHWTYTDHTKIKKKNCWCKARKSESRWYLFSGFRENKILKSRTDIKTLRNVSINHVPKYILRPFWHKLEILGSHGIYGYYFFYRYNEPSLPLSTTSTLVLWCTNRALQCSVLKPWVPQEVTPVPYDMCRARSAIFQWTKAPPDAVTWGNKLRAIHTEVASPWSQ